MATWATFQDVVRRSVLKDVTTVPTFTDKQLYDAFVWALDTFAEHHADEKIVVVTPASAIEYTLPADIYEGLDIAGFVTLTDSEGVVTPLSPILNTPGKSIQSTDGFYVWGNKLILGTVPATGITLKIHYYAHWPVPSTEADDTYVLPIPRWAEAPLALLTGAYALTAAAVGEAKLAQFRESPEKGNPEDQSLRVVVSWLIKQYENIVNQHNKQNRESFARD